MRPTSKTDPRTEAANSTNGPAASPPSAKSHARGSLIAAKSEVSCHRMIGRQVSIAHHQAYNPTPVRYSFRRPSFTLRAATSPFSFPSFTGLSIEKAMPTSASVWPGIRNAIAQNCDRQARIVRLMRNERGERLQFNLYGQR